MIAIKGFALLVVKKDGITANKPRGYDFRDGNRMMQNTQADAKPQTFLIRPLFVAFVSICCYLVVTVYQKCHLLL